MKKKKKEKVLENNELSINSKIKFIANTLDSLVKILILLEPLLEKILLMEEVEEEYYRNGTIDQIIRLFDKISKQSRELTTPSNLSNLLKDLRN